MFRRVLVANRGEIAVRIIRTLRELDMQSVAVFAEDEATQPHVRLADHAVGLGPGDVADTYLNVEAIVDAAVDTGAEAVHPGYGFLSERAALPRALAKAGIAWVGPPPEALELLGDKARALELARELDVPVTPGSRGSVGTVDEATELAEEIGYPVVVKAVHGGGGMGMVRVDEPAGMPGAWAAAREQSELAFGSDEVLVEKWWTRPRHVEVQVARDEDGRSVHLFERECSIQRRNQKLIEEAPAPCVDAELREALTSDALTLANAAGVTCLATVEFLVTQDGTHVFNEVNPRLQVEHPTTEMVTGQDLVAWQLAIAAGKPLPRSQGKLELKGWSLEARINAEDPLADFSPSPGIVAHAHVPQGEGLRVDHAIVPGGPIPARYDSMIAKVVSHGADRDQALERCRDGLARLRVGGVPTTTGLLHHVLGLDPVVHGELHTGLVDAELVDGYRALLHGAMATLVRHAAAGVGDGGLVRLDGHQATWQRDGDALLVDGVEREPVGKATARDRVEALGRVLEGRVLPALATGGAAGVEGGEVVTSPIPGLVAEVLVRAGDKVAPGTPLVVLDAMKMRNRIQAATAGVVDEVPVKPGDQVTQGAVLVRIAAAAG